MSEKKALLYKLSAILILTASVLYLFFQEVAPYIMLVGVAGFGAITFTSPYPGKSIRGKRLYNIQIFAVLLMVVSTYLMFAGMNEWVIPLLISALLTLYCAVLLPNIYEGEQQKKDEE